MTWEPNSCVTHLLREAEKGVNPVSSVLSGGVALAVCPYQGTSGAWHCPLTPAELCCSTNQGITANFHTDSCLFYSSWLPAGTMSPCLSPGQQLDLLQGSPAHPSACCCHGLGKLGQDAQPHTCSSSNSPGPSLCSPPPPGSPSSCPPAPWALLSSQLVPTSCIPQLTGIMGRNLL